MSLFKFAIVILNTFLSLIVTAQIQDSFVHVNTAFENNEELIYKVGYGFIKGGEASITIKTVSAGDSYLFHIYAQARSTGLIGSVYKIKDVYESYVEIDSGYPIKSIRNIKEHKHSSYNEVLFFRDQGFLRSLNSGDHPAPGDVLDVLSAFYFARRNLYSNELTKDQVISMLIHFDEQFYPIEIKFKEIEYVKTDFGKLKCMKFVPFLSDNKVFKKEDQFQLWVTADKNYIPIRIRVKLPVGSLKCDLIDFERIKDKNGELKKTGRN